MHLGDKLSSSLFAFNEHVLPCKLQTSYELSVSFTCIHPAADAFDDLVKEAVRSANAAAQARADYAASVVAAELAEARRDRVASKRGKRRSASPKSPKRLAWAVQEHLVQHRVFSKVIMHYILCCFEYTRRISIGKFMREHV